MKTIIRNFLSVLKRFKLATFLNILGLSVAFSAFIILMMQVNFDRGFDRFHKNANRIFRVERVGENNSSAVLSRPLIDAIIQSSPHIVKGALIDPWEWTVSFTIEQNGGGDLYKEQICKIYPNYLSVFDFHLLEGTSKALDEPGKVLLPESMAHKIFGKKTVIGNVLKEDNRTWTVGGVYKDFPRNSIVKNIMYTSMGEKENLNSWGTSNYHLYLLLDDPAAKEDIIPNFVNHFDFAKAGWEEQRDNFSLRLTHLPDIYYDHTIEYDSIPGKGSRQTVALLSLIAFLIVIIGGINFTNFSTALTPLRIKSINTQKVLGASDGTLRFSLLLEAVIISLLSWLISLAIVWGLSRTSFPSLLDADMGLVNNMPLVLFSGALALVVGGLAGLYPAFYITSFTPALVLKGSFGLTSSGRKLRNVLISVQFIASIALIIGASFMYLQNYAMVNTPLGFDKDQVVIVRLNGNVFNHRDAYVNKLKSYAGIEDVSFAEAVLSGSDDYMGWGRQYNGKGISYKCIPVHASFLRVMGIQVKEGRDFRNEDESTKYGAYIFNQKAQEEYKLVIGDKIDDAEIVGIMPNVQFASFRQDMQPLAFYVWGTENWGTEARVSYIKIKTGVNIREAVKHIRNTLTEMDDVYPFEITFYDQVLDNLYKKENNLSSLITLFGALAVFISMVGVFGLVVFESQYRRKEIGVRKINGATTTGILILFNKTYIRILVICFIIASPISYYLVHRWLENFAYRTPIYWWVFLLAFIIVLLITVITVTYQNWKAANENPVNSIKNE